MTQPFTPPAFLIAAALALGIANPASAQYGHFFNDAQMTPEDIDMASKAAEKLYSRQGVKTGDRASWDNPKSGHKGVVDVLEVEQGPCVTIRHIAATRSSPDIRYYARRCQVSGGGWVLTPK